MIDKNYLEKRIADLDAEDDVHLELLKTKCALHKKKTARTKLDINFYKRIELNRLIRVTQGIEE